MKRIAFITICLLGAFSLATSAIHLELALEENGRPRTFVSRRKLREPKIGLALSGGGARGLSHIGVLKVLEREGIPIHRIAGTSMGSVVGGLYAAGWSAKQIERIALDQNWSAMLTNTPQRSSLLTTQKVENANHILEFRLKDGRPVIPRGLTEGQRLTQILTEFTLAADYHSAGNFDSLPIPFRAIATDLVSGKIIVVKEGSLSEAMRASFAVPFAFTPVETDSMLLIDGGMLNNLPVEVARGMGADFVLGVDVKAPLKPKNELRNPLEMLDQILTLTVLQQTATGMNAADYVMTPDLSGHLSTNFSGVEQLIKQGESAAEKSITELRQRMPTPVPRDLDSANGQVSSVRWMGLETLQADSLQPLLGFKDGDSLGLSELYNGLAKLYRQGSFDAVSAKVGTGATGWDITIVTKEYPKWKPVKLAGVTVLTASELAGCFQLDTSRAINWHIAQKGLRALLDTYHHKGYILASIKEIRELDDAFVVEIDEGRIQSITVEGNSRTRGHVVLREATFKAGDVFHIRRAKQMLQQVYSTNLFQQVSLRILPGGRLVYVVEEQDPQRIQVGLRYDDVRLGEGFVRYMVDNVKGTGIRWTNHLQYGLRREKYSSFLMGDRLGGTFMFHGTGAYLYKDKRFAVDPTKPNQITAKTLRKIGLSLSLGRQIKRLGNISASLRIENFLSDTLDREWLQSNLEAYSEGIRTFSIRSTVDDLNRIPFPTSGRKHYVSMDFAHDIIGGTERFATFVASFGEYYTFWGNHTFYPRIQISYADKSLPLAAQHSLGGYIGLFSYDDMSFYNGFPLVGYAEQAFSGDCLTLLNLRYRWKTMPWMYVLVQYDVGETWAREDFRWSRVFAENEFRNLKQGLGLGIALDLPIGPVTAVFGQALSSAEKREEDLERKFHISLGHEF